MWNGAEMVEDDSLIALFPGQGSQFVGMGRKLVQRFPEASDTFDEVSNAVNKDVRALCWASTASELARTENAQLAIFTFSIAAWRVAFARSFQLVPGTVAGHSVGAVAAAVACGYLSLADGARLVQARGQIMGSVPRLGSMIAISATSADAVGEVLRLAPTFGLDVAARNGPRQIVLSGPLPGIESARAHFGARSRVLDVSNAFHSRIMEPVVHRWEQVVRAAPFKEERRLRYIASTSGEAAESVSDAADDLLHGLRDTVRWDLVIGNPSRTSWVVLGSGSALARFGRGLVARTAILSIDDSFQGGSR